MKRFYFLALFLLYGSPVFAEWWPPNQLVTVSGTPHVTCDNCSPGAGVAVTTVTFNGASQPVSGTFWQATQPVSGSVSVSNFPASQTVAGSVSVSNLPAVVAVTTVTFNGASQPVTATISGTPNVVVTNTPSVNATSVNVATVTISGTPTVSVSNTPNVSVTNTPAVSQSGAWNVNNTSVNVATVSVSGTPNVSVTNTPTVTANQGGTWNVTASSGSSISLGTSFNKVLIGKTGTLVTTAVTADQLISSYTVTAGKTFYLEYVVIQVRSTAVSAVAAIMGTVSLETPTGTKIITTTHVNPTTSEVIPLVIPFSEPIPIAAATVARLVCTPASTTSTTWVGSLGGYEK